MRQTIERCRSLLLARLGVLEEEYRLTMARYREREGDFHYVTLENTALIERHLHEIDRLRALFEGMAIEEFQTVQEFADFALAQLREVYETRALMRPSIRMVMECIRNLCEPA